MFVLIIVFRYANDVQTADGTAQSTPNGHANARHGTSSPYASSTTARHAKSSPHAATQTIQSTGKKHLPIELCIYSYCSTAQTYSVSFFYYHQQQNVVQQPPKDTKGMTTITAKPQIRNLSADVTRFVPSALRVKREDKKIPKPKQYTSEYSRQQQHETTQAKGTTKDDAYMQFMREMQGLL